MVICTPLTDPYRPLANDELAFVLQHHWRAIGLTLSADDFTDGRRRVRTCPRT